jgi:ribosome-binding protein aMBF1 (putative translation factor)
MSESTWVFEVLPNRLSPYPGECVSGYLVRLAEANGFTVFWDFASDLFPRWHTTQQYPLLRWEYPIDDWGRIPLRAQISLAQLRAMSVAPWLEKFHPPVILRRPGILSPGHWLGGAVRPNLKICPHCLGTQPYIRLLWRLMPVQVCLEHRCLLQGECSECGHTLRIMSTAQRHLRCADCGIDLRRLPTMSAPEESLPGQARRQADLQFLLRPDVSLVKLPSGGEVLPADLPKAVGLKLRYVREQAGLSASDVARQVKTVPTMIGMIEAGKQTPLATYLSYLDVLAMSWSAFAEVEVPSDFRLRETPEHLSLRICPNSECPNHQGPSEHVRIRLDMPTLQKVWFQCRTCGRSFARSYDGQLSTRPEKSPVRRSHSRELHKPHDELTRLVKLGKQGLSDKRIAHELGWSVTAVRRHWIVLGMEEEIRQTQGERYQRNNQKQVAALRARVEQVLQALIQQDEEITLECVSRILHCSHDRLLKCPGLVQHIRTMGQTHNPQVRQRREEALSTQLQCALADLKQPGHSLRIAAVTGRVGIAPGLLANTHPAVYATVRDAVNKYNAKLKLERRQKECAQIDEAAARMVAQGIRLTYYGILREAGVSKNRMEADPVIRERLEHWIGDPTQHW